MARAFSIGKSWLRRKGHSITMRDWELHPCTLTGSLLTATDGLHAYLEDAPSSEVGWSQIELEDLLTR